MNQQEEKSLLSMYEPWCVLRHILYNLWMILLSAVIGVLCASMVLQLFFQDKYGARMTYLVQSRTTTAAYGSNSAAVTVAATFSELLGSDFIHNKITEAAGLESFSGTISAVNTPDTNMITISVVADTSREAFLISDAISRNTDSLMRYIYSGATLSSFNAPVTYSVPTVPVSASRLKLVAGGLCALAMLILLLYDMMLQDTVQTITAARSKLDAKLLLVIGHERRPLGRARRPLLLTEPTVSFSFSESVHRLRAQLEQQKQSSGCNLFLITSVMEHEGKSSISENLALSLGQKYNSVLLVDCDFRKPSRFAARKGDWTVRQIQCGKVPFTFAYSKSANIYTIYTRHLLKNPSELMASQEFSDMIDQFCQNFAFVLIDTPPLELFSDAESLADMDSSSLLVVHQDIVPAPVINDVIDNLNGHATRFMGYVLNDVHVLLPGLLQQETYGYSYGFQSYGGYGSYGKYGKYGAYGKYESAARNAAEEGGETDV